MWPFSTGPWLRPVLICGGASLVPGDALARYKSGTPIYITQPRPFPLTFNSRLRPDRFCRRCCRRSPLCLRPAAAPRLRLRADAPSRLCLLHRDAGPSPPRKLAPRSPRRPPAPPRARAPPFAAARLPAPSASGSCAAPGRPQRHLRTVRADVSKAI